MAQHQANKWTTLDSGVPVWGFSLIYSCTTPSLLARFSDTPRVTASSLRPRTRTTCRWDCGPAPGGERAAKGHSGSCRRLSREGVKDSRPAPLLHRPPPPTEGLHERSCPRGRWCWNQNRAPGWRARHFPGHRGGCWGSHSWRGCDRQASRGADCYETWWHVTACTLHSLVGRKGWTQIFFSALWKK